MKKLDEEFEKELREDIRDEVYVIQRYVHHRYTKLLRELEALAERYDMYVETECRYDVFCTIIKNAADLTMNFDKDNCRSRVDNSCENLAVFRHIALNLYKSFKSGKNGYMNCHILPALMTERKFYDICNE